VTVSELFSNASDPVDLVTRFDRYKNALNKSRAAAAGGLSLPQQRIADELTLNKSLSPEMVASVAEGLSHSPDFLGKDLNLAGPGTALVPYDLSAPAKELYPRNTPLRNRFARTRGYGTAHEFKRILGITGSGTAGLANTHPGISETGTTSWSGRTLVRPPVIQIAADDLAIPYRMFGTSERVTSSAFWAGQGYQDIQQLASTSALWSAMLLEERMLLSGRGTASGFSGALAVPSAPTVTTPVASGSQTAVTGVTTNVYALVVAATQFGSTPIGAVGTSAFTAGDVVNIAWTAEGGGERYDIYVGQGSVQPAFSAFHLVGSTYGSNTNLLLQGALVTSSAAASTVTSTDTTAFSAGYDGLIPILTNPALAGSVQTVSGGLTDDSPFQTLFSQLYANNQADPETVWMNAADRSALSDILKDANSASYRIMLQNGQDASVGAVVTGLQNQSTGRVVDLNVHPFMPKGIALATSEHLPVPNSNISNCFEVVNVQDYVAYQWPQIELALDCSVVWTGTFCAYAPAFSGSVVFGPTS
jgi:hypothetical protein